MKTQIKNPHAVSLGHLGGIKGGKQRARLLTPKQRKEIAKKGAAARWGIPYQTEESNSYITIPIPIRKDVVVEIENVPHNITLKEAEKIGRIINALAFPPSYKFPNRKTTSSA